MPEKTTIELVKAETFELDPTKQYVLIFDRRTINAESVSEIGKMLHKQGINGVLVMLMGDPKTVRIIEQAKKDKEN